MTRTETNRMGSSGDDARSDEALVAVVQADPRSPAGREAMAALCSRYRDRLYAWCFRLARDRERALDLAQETFLGACRSIHRFEGRSRFSSWLFAIARYRWLSATRVPRLMVDEEVDMEDIVEESPSLEEQYIRREQERLLLARMDQVLEPVEHAALWLRCVECKPVDEITRILQLDSKSGARGVLQAARRKLRALPRGEREPGEAT